MAESTRDGNADHRNDTAQNPSGRIRPKARISVPMTAMIDVTFLLLTYFLLTTTFRQAEGQLPGTLPGDGPVELNIVRVDVRAVGENCQSAVYSIVGQNKPIRSPRELVESLRAQGRGENTIVEIQAGRAVRWRYVVEAYNQAAAADFKATMRI